MTSFRSSNTQILKIRWHFQNNLRLLFTLLCSFILLANVCAQNKTSGPTFIIRGKITEIETGERVSGASVFIHAMKQGTTSNSNGEYFLHLPEGKYNIRLSSVGYENLDLSINLVSDTIIISEMKVITAALEEVVVTGEDDRVNSLRLGQNTLDLNTLRKIPPLMGEVDIIRSLLLMPGVSTVGEGATGFNVRGGSVDQNLVLLDDAPVFNTSHLFGFLTAFNSDAVRHADLFKGGVPARFGGRASSVLDIHLKQGNRNHFTGSAGISLMTTNATVESPLISGKTTLLISGRTSYSDWLLKTIPQKNVADSRASFYDAVVKLTHTFNKNNLLSVTGYGSHDSFKFPGDTTYQWTTHNLSLKWSTTINPSLFINTSAAVSNYAYTVEGTQQTNEFKWKAGIGYWHIKSDAEYTFNERHTLSFGAGIENYNVNLGTLRPLHDSNINAFAMDHDHGIIAFAHVSHQFNAGDRFSLRTALRGSLFELRGPRSLNTYEEGLPKSESTFLGSNSYEGQKTIQRYQYLEPRVLIKYSLTPTSSVKAAYDQTAQYLHLISNTSAVSPVDLWKLSDPYLKPQISKQVSVGYFKSLNHAVFEFSIEAFYKDMSNVVDYKDGATLLLNDKLEAGLLQGTGRAYGSEWMIEKKKGRFTGWLSYTLSRTERRIKGAFPEETVNKGSYYPANYDKPHNISFTGSYSKRERVTWGFNFVFASGRPITYPTSSYGYGGARIVNFEYRNNERSPAYHRLDLSVQVKSKVKPSRAWSSYWTFSLYNVYARKNPYSIFFRSEHQVLAQSYRLAVIGTIVPSLSYKINF
jgi:hypothetical protein